MGFLGVRFNLQHCITLDSGDYIDVSVCLVKETVWLTNMKHTLPRLQRLALADSASDEGPIHSLYVAAVLLCKPPGRKG